MSLPDKHLEPDDDIGWCPEHDEPRPCLVCKREAAEERYESARKEER